MTEHQRTVRWATGKLAHAVALLAYSWEMAGSIFGRDADYPE
jgi:hypothetical protein